MRIESALGVYNITITSARGIYRMIHRRCRQIAVLLIGNDCCVRRYDRPSVATRSDRIGWTTCERRILCSGGWYSHHLWGSRDSPSVLATSVEDLEDSGVPLCGSPEPSRINEYLRCGLYKSTAERGKQNRV
ncbi:unnamed protein product [Acanthoscelides obtectus]|uniref:Uncharacterized protein n=1 Tax=Acanthoscelides obtectus TaxID=200917 RepID=A0A9P0JKB4_ACAOB|nr:unnamed protein product [Acanthoscelides obtectus]CAK1657894.1 hypothetical protein AOBTE_LOCUS20590 [Acanthoscelides obtectus]